MNPEDEKLKSIAKSYVEKLKADNEKIAELCSSNAPRHGKREKPLVHRQGFSPALFEKTLVMRVEKAMKHYVKGDPSLLNKENALKSHCNGIDFTKPIDIITLPANVQLTQLQVSGKGMGETRQGNYYSIKKKEEISDIDKESHLRGIAPSTVEMRDTLSDSLDSPYKYYTSDKASTTFYTTEDIEVLITNCEAITDNWSMKSKGEVIEMIASGGGEQIHVNSKENATIQSELKLNCDRYIELLSSGTSVSASELDTVIDELHVYAMVLYNRASFNADLLVNAVDAYINVLDKFQGKEKTYPHQEIIEIFKGAVASAVEKKSNLMDYNAIDAAVQNLVDERRAEKAKMRPQHIP